MLSEKAKNASQVNLTAKLEDRDSKSKDSNNSVWRLFALAKAEKGALTSAFALLCVSSAVSLSIPFSIGRILDVATADSSMDQVMFGLRLSDFYVALGAVFLAGSAANFGRILILRIAGERIVARLRTRLYSKTFRQDAEFFDANSRYYTCVEILNVAAISFLDSLMIPRCD